MVRQRQKGQIPNTVLILEHYPVITLGARKSANRLLVETNTLTEMGIEIASVRRGGGTTAHNPGQVVLYPVLSLHSLELGINEYIRSLEAVGIELLDDLGLKCQTRKGLPGLWIGERKIGSIGVKVSRSVTYHGMAINICNDLSIFETIVPCGLEGVEITNVLNETGTENPMADVKRILEKLCLSHWSGREPADNEKHR